MISIRSTGTVALAAAIALVGATGCGGDDDGGDRGQGAASTGLGANEGGGTEPEAGIDDATPQQQAATRAQQRQVTRSARRAYRAVAAGDAQGLCGTLAPAARRKVAAAASSTSNSPADSLSRSCVNGLEHRLSDMTPATRKQLRQAVIGEIESDGARATATVAFSRQSAGSISFVADDGVWRITGFSLPPPRDGD